jgi:hypothetical protein
VATQSGNAEDLENVKELWVRLGLRDPSFPAEEMACYGCKPENKCAYPELRACASEKTFEKCGLCHEYPCELITAAAEASEKLHSRVTNVCTYGEIETLKKAFFSKRQNLDRIHSDMNEKSRTRCQRANQGVGE